MNLFQVAYLLFCTSETLGWSYEPCVASPRVSNDTFSAQNRENKLVLRCARPIVNAKPADHLLLKDADGTQTSTTGIAGITADSSLPQASTHPTESPPSPNSISVKRLPSRPTGRSSKVDGSLPTEQQPVVSFGATDGPGTSATSFTSATGVITLLNQNLTTPAAQIAVAMEALPADSLKTSLGKEPDKPVTTEIHTIPVFLDKPTQATKLLASVNQPYTSDSGNPFVLTNSPRQSLIQLPTLIPGEALTYSGTLISLASDGSQVIIRPSTEAVALSPSVTRHAGVPVAVQLLQAIPTNGLMSQPTNSPNVKSGVSLTKTGKSTLGAAGEAPDTARASDKAIAQPFGTTQSSGLPSESQSAVAEQSFIQSHPLAASGIVVVSGTLVSLGPGLPSIVMGTQVQATGSHGIGSPSRGLSNGTSPLAFQGSATRAHIMWGGFVTIASVALISMLLV